MWKGQFEKKTRVRMALRNIEGNSNIDVSEYMKIRKENSKD